MLLNNIFKKSVKRPIEGVIKADDEASLRLEIEEYVLTNEVEKRLQSFLDAYNNYEGANGVWISGFFGSGKSHLLKILALLLENRTIDGARTLDLFLAKCGDDEILRGGLKLAASTPSKSILFNIDQKADVISKTQIDALLAVFVKVFDEACGYYGKQGHIAHFERDLDSRGLYEKFKEVYEAKAGRSWYKGREQALLESDHIAKAYAEVAGGSDALAQGILDKYRSEYKVSIEDFAAQVQAFIDRQEPKFRLNFFVDEVGQYIADNVKLMTNLQTIAESLATKCRGRAWVIVTAQEDMGSVVGEMSRQQGNDFTKIQARFANRMKLTSADVAEVIQKRLLEKTEEGSVQLSDVYQNQVNNFKTLFDFADGAQTYRNFQDRDHFIQSYPFIPYQFALFQAAIQTLSQHNAFEGKHSSVGERSMLGVFQQVAIKIGDRELGSLATFDLMFEGIRSALKSQIQRAVIQAEGHLGNDFAVRILKSLFLLKYVKEFKPTVRNLCVLMLDGFNLDLPVLKKNVEEALNLLEQQTYVQRNGELYEYLTDEEKDVEQEIKSVEVDVMEVAAELDTLIFDHVLKSPRIRYDEAGQDYRYSRKLDNRLYGREQELSIHILSPFGELFEDQTLIAAKSMGSQAELFVILPPDDRLVRDLMMYKRAEKYIRQNTSITQRDEVKRILSDKGHQNLERIAELRRHVSILLGRAKIYLAGTELEIGGEDGQSRLVKGFRELIARAYPNLRMLRGIQFTEEHIKTILQGGDGTLLGNDATSLSEAEQEILAFIQSNNRGGIRTTLKNLLERFERKPYGWPYPAVLCTLASLCARGKVEVRSDSNILESDELERALRNTHGHPNVILAPQVEFSASQVRVLKSFYEDFFDSPPESGEAKALGIETGIAFQNLLHQLSPLASQATQYPFLGSLNPVLDELKEVSGKPYIWYLSELGSHQDKLLQLKEEVVDPIRKFMNGPQKGIYDDARKFIQEQTPNFAYLPDGSGSSSSSELNQALNHPDCFKGNRMQQVKVQIDALREQVNSQIEVEIANATVSVMALCDRLCNSIEFGMLDQTQRDYITRPFDELRGTIGSQKIIAIIKDGLRQFEANEYPRLLDRLSSWATQSSTTVGDSGPKTDSLESEAANAVMPSIEYVSGRNLTIPFNKPWLADEADVERYVELTRQALMAEIRNGKRIRI